jgi:transposase
MKSELGLRPVYHQKERRVDGHLFITALAYHVLTALRFKLRKQGMTQNWSTIRKGLSTHMRITMTMKRADGKMIHIRKSSSRKLFLTNTILKVRSCRRLSTVGRIRSINAAVKSKKF